MVDIHSIPIELTQMLKTNPRNSENINELLQEQEVSFAKRIESLYERTDLRKIAHAVFYTFKRSLRMVTWQDIHNEAIIRLVISLQEGRFKGDSKLTYYFKKICWNYCSELLSKDKPVDEERWVGDWLFDPEQVVFSEEIETIVLKLLDQQSKNCKKIFELLFYYPKAWEMSDIANELNLSGSRSAITTYSRCKKKFIKAIEDNDRLRKLLKSYL